MAKGLIFDFGGTLDTGGIHWGKKIWHHYQRHAVPVDEESYRKAYVYTERYLGNNPVISPTDDFKKLLRTKITMQLEYLGNLKGLKLQSHADSLVEGLYSETLTTLVKSRRVLTDLKDKYPLVLVSNFYGNIGTILHEFGLNDLFRNVIESDVVGIRKPDARIFGLGVDALGLPGEQIIVIGDSITKDILPAKSIGCMTIWIKGEGWTDAPADETVPDAIITDIEGLKLLV